jgi:hypothetical protein
MTKTPLLTMLAMAIPALAQSTIKDALVKHWKGCGHISRTPRIIGDKRKYICA